MRAKLKINSITQFQGMEVLEMAAVCKEGGYPEDGSDEDNTFARWTPTAGLKMSITNPDLLGKFKPGEKFYLDFTKAEA